MSLADGLDQYRKALDALMEVQQEAVQHQQQAALDVLAARDAVQHLVQEAPAIPADQLIRLDGLDHRLRGQKNWIFNTIDVPHWRSLVNPPERAWWWYEPPALAPFLEQHYPWLDRLDWLWTFLSLFFLTLSVTLVLDTLNRVVGEGLNTQGMFPVVVQVLLTIAGGSAALTEKGRNWLKSLMTRLRIPSHFRQEFGAIAALLILLIVGSIHQVYLPQLATNRYSDGLAHYEAGQFDSALQAYQQAIAIRPDQVAVHYHLGLLYEDLQRTDEAIAEYQLVISQDPEELNQLIWLKAHNNLGRLYILNGDSRHAWVPLERAFTALEAEGTNGTEFQQERYSLLKNLDWMWLTQNRFAEADEVLTQAIDLDTQTAAAHCLKAQVLEGLDREGEANAHWKRCLAEERQILPEEAEWAAIAREKLEAKTE